MKSQLKYLQTLFYDLLNDYGRVFVLVKYSGDSIIGNRGFTEEEKRNGIVLVFSKKNYRNLKWAEDGSLTATLSFGSNNKPEKCFLAGEDIISVFSPDAKVKLDRWDIRDKMEDMKESYKTQEVEKVHRSQEKVISLNDFKKTKD
ncbi:MAG: hypothetical protein AB1390_02245 [Nitrospirota bacterium]